MAPVFTHRVSSCIRIVHVKIAKSLEKLTLIILKDIKCFQNWAYFEGIGINFNFENFQNKIFPLFILRTIQRMHARYHRTLQHLSKIEGWFVGSRSNRPQTKSTQSQIGPSQIGPKSNRPQVESAPSQIGPIFVVYYCQHAKLNSLNTIQQKCFVPVYVYHWYENKLNINVWLYLAMLKIINNLADKSSVSAYIWCTFPPCTLSMRRTLISFCLIISSLNVL